MKKILFPTDFSEAAKNAFEYALELAARVDGVIDLISVYHLPVSEAGSVPPQYIERMLIEKKQEVEWQMRDFLKPYEQKHIGTVRADYGLFIYQEIADAAEQEGYDIIVMGTKGEHNNMEKLLGSVTTSTMMQAPCPVLAVPADAGFKEIQRIAYATDFQPSDEHAVGRLKDFAGLLDASIHFVHVDTTGKNKKAEDFPVLENYPLPFTDFSVVSSSSVIEGLEDYIQLKDIQLLALFIPRRRLWERLFHSSLTKRMTFQTQIPVLVFRQ